MRHTIELPLEQENALATLAKKAGLAQDEALRAILTMLLGDKNLPVEFSSLVSELVLRIELPVQSTEDVMGGDACIRNTRIPVWTLVDYKGQGLSDAALLEAFPILNVADLSAAWDYYASHSEEVNAQRQRHEDAA